MLHGTVHYVVMLTDDGVEEMVTMEPDLATTAHMKFVDNRCGCCPYGYHIDIDFLRYLDSLGKSTSATDSVTQLRKSMELFLRQKELEAAGGGAGVDVDVQRQVYDQSQAAREYEFSTGVMDSSRSSVRPKYRAEAAMNVNASRHPDRPDRDYDSSSSVSIYSGPSSPTPYSTRELVSTAGRQAQGPSPSWRPGEGYAVTQNGAHGEATMSMMQKTMTSQAMVTGGEVSDEVETFLVDGVVNPGHPGIPADMTLISSATLQTIREQMAASLQRMKQLEDENDSMRQLEVWSLCYSLLATSCPGTVHNSVYIASIH